MLPPKCQEVNQNKHILTDSFECAICLGIAMEPTLVPSCEHIFCHKCISKSVRFRPECPTCRSAFDPDLLKQIESGTALFRFWSCISVKCASCDDGCAWTGSMPDYSSHAGDCKFQRIAILEGRLVAKDHDIERILEEKRAELQQKDDMIEDLEEVEVVLRDKILGKNDEIEGLENWGRELREDLQKKIGEIERLENSGRELREELQALKKTNAEIRKGMQEKDEEIQLLLQGSSYNRMQIGALKTTATRELAKSNEEIEEMNSKILLLEDISRKLHQKDVSNRQHIQELTKNESLLTKQLSNAIEKIEDMRMSVSMLEDDTRQRKRARNVTRFVRGWYGEET